MYFITIVNSLFHYKILNDYVPVIVDILYLTNLTDSDELITVQREELVGQHIGETSQKTSSVINDARGGTLFVDEVYRLVPPDSTRDFGPQAKNTLMGCIEGGPQTETDRPAIIMAGYPESMERVISCNRGLARRITDRFVFADYSVPELVQIIHVMARKNNFIIHDECTSTKLEEAILASIKTDVMSNLNATVSERIYNAAKDQLKNRLVLLILEDNEPDRSALMTLRLSDFLGAISIVGADLSKSL